MSRAQDMQQGVVECDQQRAERRYDEEWCSREMIRGVGEGGTDARRYGNGWESESETR